MDILTEPHSPAPTPARTQATTPALTRTGAETARAVPLPLPFDDEAERPIPFMLTAAAQREVLGRDMPALSVVPATAEPVDTRPVQARALLRSGMPVATVAAALGVAVSDVEGWTADLVDELARRRRTASRRTATVPADAAPRPAPSGAAPAAPRADARTVPADPGRRAPLLAGLAFALAEIDERGVTLLHDRVEPVAVLLDALRASLPDFGQRMRVALRVGHDLPSDRVRIDVAARLGFDAGRIRIGRGGASSGSTLEIRVDVADARAAELVSAWRHGSGGDAAGLRGWD
jgi:hypothetical protein